MKISELKQVLYKYVKDYISLKELRESNSYNLDLCYEILRCLDDFMSNNYEDIILFNICLETVFGNKYNDLVQFVYSKKFKNSLGINDNDLNLKILKITEEIKKQYSELKEQDSFIKLELDENMNRLISARRILSCLKYSQLISKDDISNVGEILRKLKYDDSDISIAIEMLFIHNKDVLSKQNGYIFKDKYKFVNLLSLGFEKFEYPDVFNEEKLLNISNTMFEMIQGYYGNSDFYDKIIPAIGDNVCDINELEFVLIKLLEKIQNKIIELIDLIKDKDFVMDLEIKNSIAKDCYNLMFQYNFFRNYMDGVVSQYNENNESIKEKQDDNRQVNNLFYLDSKPGNCYMISDLKKVSFEYLDKFYELINDFKNNKISKKKNKPMAENSKARGFMELKDDQVRIIYKRIKDNDYLVYGLFVKKDNRKYRVQFDSIINRSGTINQDSAAVEDELAKYVSENSRKWSR